MEPAYILSGEVTHGRGKGHLFGLPTANLRLSPGAVLPPTGVYIARVRVAAGEYIGVTNIGTRPTVDADPDLTVETLLLDFSGDLYGQPITLLLYTRLRGLCRFESTRELVQQIARDSACARGFFEDPRNRN